MPESDEPAIPQPVPGLQQKKVFKIIVLGDSNVGKTCLTYRFCEGQFLDKSEATIGVDFRERTVRINNEEIKLQLWDTAGQERFRKSMVQHYYRNVHAVVIVYDVSKPETFYSVSSWMQEVESHGLLAAPRVLVGNKCDRGTAEARVATACAPRLADKYTMPLFETSALLDSEINTVNAIFLTLAHKLYSRQPLRLISVEGDQSFGRVTLPRPRPRPGPRPRPRSAAARRADHDACLCS